jgi:Resolvase, N terminal domain
VTEELEIVLTVYSLPYTVVSGNYENGRAPLKRPGSTPAARSSASSVQRSSTRVVRDMGADNGRATRLALGRYPRCSSPARGRPAMRVIGYLRASTEEQQRSGLGLAAQEAAISAACAQREWELVSFEEDIASGGKRDRAGLARAFAALDEGRADAVVVSRLDRLGRSVAHVASILERYPGGVVAVDIGMTPDSPREALARLRSLHVGQRVHNRERARLP